MSMRKTSKPQQIDGLRETIKALQAERSTLLAQPRSRVEIVAAVDDWVTHSQQQGDAAMHREVAKLAAGQPAELLRVKGLSVGSAGAAVATIDLGPMLVALLGADAVRAAFLARMETLPEGMDTTARRLRLAEIDAELDTLEAEEEREIETSESTSWPIARRADARPEIVLALP